MSEKGKIVVQEMCDFLNVDWDKDYPPLKDFYVEESTFNEDSQIIVCDEKTGKYSPASGITTAAKQQLHGCLSRHDGVVQKDLIAEFRKWKALQLFEIVVVKVPKDRAEQFKAVATKFLSGDEP